MGRRHPSKLAVWLLGARPKTLPAAAVPVAVGGVMAFAAGSFDALVFAVTLTAALLIQIATNFVNDYFDYVKGTDTSDRQGPLRITQAGLVTGREMRRAIGLTAAAAGLAGLYLVSVGGVPILLIGILSLLCVFGYTAGPRPLSYSGLADVFVLVFFGPLAVGGTYFLLAGGAPIEVPLVGASLGSISTAILVVNNLRDIETDRAAGKRTLAVRFGARFARLEYLALLTFGAVGPLIIISVLTERLAVHLASLYLLAAVPVARRVARERSGEALNHELARTGLLLVLFGALFSLGWLWGQ